MTRPGDRLGFSSSSRVPSGLRVPCTTISVRLMVDLLSRALSLFKRSGGRNKFGRCARLTGPSSPLLLGTRHPDETALMLAGQRPEKRAHIGTLVEEADCVDAD